MTKLYLNNNTERLVEAVVNNLPQSLLVTGPSGVGLTTLAKEIANRLNVKPTLILPEKDDKINITQGVIGVETMRQLSSETNTKSDRMRIIIIDYAETMTTQAQNAFLKLLEEPGKQLHMILVSSSTSRLLPTILSRVEVINVKSITVEQTNRLLSDLNVTEQTKVSQLLFMASGLPAEITRLIKDDEYFNRRVDTIKDAREFITGSLYRKLMVINGYKDDRSLAIAFLNDASKMLEKSLLANAQPETLKLSDKIIKATERLNANGNIRLCLAQVVL